MTWLDSLTLGLYLMHTVLVGIGWAPMVELYNRVIIFLEGVAK